MPSPSTDSLRTLSPTETLILYGELLLFCFSPHLRNLSGMMRRAEMLPNQVLF